MCRKVGQADSSKLIITSEAHFFPVFLCLLLLMLLLYISVVIVAYCVCVFRQPVELMWRLLSNKTRLVVTTSLVLQTDGVPYEYQLHHC